MKLGPRKPNIKSKVKARTTGKVKRQVKSAVNPTYGKKGMGVVNNPKKAAYNKVYNKTTYDPLKTNKKSSTNTVPEYNAQAEYEPEKINKKRTCLGCLVWIFVIILILSLFV